MTIEIVNYDERRSHIAHVLSGISQTQDFIFQKKTYHPKIISLDPKYLLYRLTNTRTGLKHKQFILDNAKSKDFFKLDREENQEVQEAEHEILTNQNTKDLRASYERKGGQDEALLIYPDGRIINGNTRVAFMRNENMSPIKCMVLDDPFLADKEMEIESEADIALSGKIDYDDLSIGYSILTLYETQTPDQIAKSKQLSVVEVKVLAKAYQLAEKKLQLEGHENDWSRVAESVQIYKDAAAVIINAHTTPLKGQIISSSVMLIDAASSEAAPGRKYKHLANVINHSDNVSIFFQDIFGKKEGGDSPFDDDNSGYNIFDNEAFEESFSSQDKIDSSADALLVKLDVHIDKLADYADQAALKGHINKVAKSILASVNILNRDDLSVDGLQEKLQEIESGLEKIEKYVSNKSNSQ